MRTFSRSLEDVEDYAIKVTVHGLSRRASVRRLIRALAGIPCYPLVIYKIDRSGKLLGVIDAQAGHRLFYVQVRHWGRDPDRLPDIGWVSDPGKLGRGLRRRAEKQLMDYESGVRRRSMVVEYSGKSHLELCLELAPKGVRPRPPA